MGNGDGDPEGLRRLAVAVIARATQDVLDDGHVEQQQGAVRFLCSRWGEQWIIAAGLIPNRLRRWTEDYRTRPRPDVQRWSRSPPPR